MKQTIAITFTTLLAFSVPAQDDLSLGIEAVSASAQPMLTQVIFGGGFFGLLIWILLFAVSTVAVAVAIKLLWGMRKSCFTNTESCEQVDNFCNAQNFNDAYGVTHEHSDAYSAAMNAVFENFHEADVTHDELATNAVDKLVRSHLRLISNLQTCGNIAPMLGLLGTVTGMVSAFMGLGTQLGPEKASILAVSISQALYTTAAGLLIAVPCLALVTQARNTLEKRVQVLNDALTKTLRLTKKATRNYSSTQTTKFHNE